MLGWWDQVAELKEGWSTSAFRRENLNKGRECSIGSNIQNQSKLSPDIIKPNWDLYNALNEPFVGFSSL
jgi:hypothetical protein